ncbi:hypothetical protein Ae505Ps2_6133 [Pseudonocardia sp. Ae505_Ps2]|nr:hypothetical protein Ae505Ps2_6133 [Pseudonocardia sp. Ae505_Ps2]
MGPPAAAACVHSEAHPKIKVKATGPMHHLMIFGWVG